MHSLFIIGNKINFLIFLGLLFKNQQVIINFYEEGELIQREGLFFESIHIADHQIQFSKGGKIVLTLPFGGYMNFSHRSEFKNYYSLEKGNKRVELYFP